MTPVYLLLGSNLGDRVQNLSEARKRLAFDAGSIIAASEIYESLSWGYESESKFLNQALCLETALRPVELLNTIHMIEAGLGRIRNKNGGWEDRIIDIDILLFGNAVIDIPGLVIPHKLLHIRKFALEPLAEIAAEKTHPVFGKTIRHLLAKCTETVCTNP